MTPALSLAASANDAPALHVVNAARAAELTGGTWLLDGPDRLPAAWGSDDEVLWASGEPLLVCAPQGVGKSTLTQQLLLARAGILEPTLLGHPVAVDERPVVYIAADRPSQARQSMRRMVEPKHRPQLDARLIPWCGPLPFQLADDPGQLAKWLRTLGAGAVCIDSLKDVALGLSDDKIGGAIQQAMQHVVAAGIELVANHHQRKGQDGRKPRTLDDVYGSTWITAGAGSVVLLWGEPGDAYVELHHLKQPAAEVGPLKLHHDHARGRTTLADAVDLLDLAATGLTVADAAKNIYETDAPTREQKERARRRLEKLVSSGNLVLNPGRRPRDPGIFTLSQREARVAPRAADTCTSTTLHDLAPEQYTQDYTTDHDSPNAQAAPPFKGAGAALRVAGRRFVIAAEDATQ